MEPVRESRHDVNPLCGAQLPRFQRDCVPDAPALWNVEGRWAAFPSSAFGRLVFAASSEEAEQRCGPGVIVVTNNVNNLYEVHREVAGIILDHDGFGRDYLVKELGTLHKPFLIGSGAAAALAPHEGEVVRMQMETGQVVPGALSQQAERDLRDYPTRLRGGETDEDAWRSEIAAGRGIERDGVRLVRAGGRCGRLTREIHRRAADCAGTMLSWHLSSRLVRDVHCVEFADLMMLRKNLRCQGLSELERLVEERDAACRTLAARYKHYRSHSFTPEEQVYFRHWFETYVRVLAFRLIGDDLSRTVEDILHDALQRVREEQCGVLRAAAFARRPESETAKMMSAWGRLQELYRGGTLAWRELECFATHYEVITPTKLDANPEGVIEELLRRLRDKRSSAPPGAEDAALSPDALQLLRADEKLLRIVRLVRAAREGTEDLPHFLARGQWNIRGEIALVYGDFACVPHLVLGLFLDEFARDEFVPRRSARRRTY